MGRDQEPQSPAGTSGLPEVEDLRAEVAQLREALETRDAIGQAKGIIRLLTGRDSQTAFEILGRVSQDTNRKLKDVAVLIADCASSNSPLPADLRASWCRRTGEANAAADPAATRHEATPPSRGTLYAAGPQQQQDPQDHP